MTTQPQFLVCPFCGQPPRLKAGKVKCVNNQCKVQPKTAAWYAKGYEHNAANDWNERRQATAASCSAETTCSAETVQKVLETCAAAGVERVVAAGHHGMIFLLSNGPEQIGGIVYRDDALKFSGMKTLASEVNAALPKQPT